MASRELSILVTAKNLASKVLGGVKGDVKSLESTASRAGSNIGRNIGIGVGLAAAGIATQVKTGIDSLVELERVNNLTAAALASTGNSAKQSVEGIRARAEEMERMSGVDDKVIQNAENLLLTFTNVGEKAFEPTLEAAVNLNAALGGGDEGLQGVLLQVAKAVNDPVRGMTALRRSGVSFTEAQQKQVKEMVAANDLMGAQALILGELEKQFGGAAEAANQGIGGSQKRFADAIEDMQMALAKGFLPVIEKASDALGRLVADPAFIAGVESFGNTLASGFEEAIDFAQSLDWGAIGNALSTAGAGARAVMDAFLGAPPWLQTAILTGWGLNKLTGGLAGSLVGELGKGLIKGVLGMNAGVVNINAATVNGPAGLAGPAGAAGGAAGGIRGAINGRGLIGGLATGVAAASPLLAAGAAIEVVNFENMRNESRQRLDGILDEMPRTPEKIDQTIARIQSQIDMERPFLEGVLFNTNVRPQLEEQIAELQRVKAAQDRSVAAARDAIPWAQRNVAAVQQANASEANRHSLSLRTMQTAAQQAQSFDRALLSTAATQTGLQREGVGVQRGILAKKSSVTAVINTTVNVSLQEWQRRHVSSIRANSNSGGFI